MKHPYLLFLSVFAIVVHAQAPDLIIVNANVYTMAEPRARAEAFAVRDGLITAVGGTDEIQALAGDGTEKFDAQGMTVMPGFIDAHCHPRPIYPFESRFATVDVSPDAVPDMDALVARLKEKAEITPEGQWISGRGYQDTKLGRHPTRHDLDKATTKHPIIIVHSSGHISAVNTMALENAKVTAETPDLPGGAFDREEDGFPNGICRERAAYMVRMAGPPMPTPSRADEVAALLRCYDNFLAKGITSAGVAGGSPDDFKLAQDAREAGAKVRIYFMFRETYLDQVKAAGLRTGFGDAWVKLGGIKAYHGNSLSGRTCWLYEPYDSINPKTGMKDYYGIPPARSQEDLNTLVKDIHDAGFQSAIHANGDREIDMLLDAYELVLKDGDAENRRHRIEHASVANEKILERAARLGVILALHSYVYEHGDKMEEYGEWRWPMMHANRTALDMGIHVAGNSDYPVSAADAMLRVQSLVTRTSSSGKVYGREQKLTIEKAIYTWTRGAAYAQFEEDMKGAIAEGMLADFVVFEDDPARVVPLSIKDIDVVRTYVGGELAYEK